MPYSFKVMELHIFESRKTFLGFRAQLPSHLKEVVINVTVAGKHIVEEITTCLQKLKLKCHFESRNKLFNTS